MVNFRMEREETERLDRYAKSTGLSRSALIRHLVAEGLARLEVPQAS